MRALGDIRLMGVQRNEGILVKMLWALSTAGWWMSEVALLDYLWWLYDSNLMIAAFVWGFLFAGGSRLPAGTTRLPLPPVFSSHMATDVCRLSF